MMIRISRPRSVSSRGPAPTLPRIGAACVEFAAIAPVLMILVLGAVEVSRGIMINEALCSAARNGCRAGSHGGGTNAEIIAQTKKTLTDNNLNADAATITILVNDSAVADAKDATRDDKISVRVTIPVSEVYWSSSLVLNESIQLSETVVMMRQK